jgi:hypothetical protein
MKPLSRLLNLKNFHQFFKQIEKKHSLIQSMFVIVPTTLNLARIVWGKRWDSSPTLWL